MEPSKDHSTEYELVVRPSANLSHSLGDLPVGTCLEVLLRTWIKLRDDDYLALDDFELCKLDSSIPVVRIFTKMRITLD